MTARYIIGDVLNVLPTLEESSVDLVLSSPPFLALRSYLPADHPDKAKEGGSQATPGEFIDWLVDVVEACDRVLAPHGSLVFELGDTYAGSGGAGGDYDPGGWREGQQAFEGSGKRYIDAKYERIQYGDHAQPIRNLHGKRQGGGDGWPADKSLTLIPELFRLTLVYGFNPLTGRQTKRWRLRNVIRWVRPNPPVGALGDKFRPATSELMVFCRTDEAGRRRYFDLDAVREPHVNDRPQLTNGIKNVERSLDVGKGHGFIERTVHPAGAPPLDWWEIPPGGYSGAHYAVWPPELLIKPIKAMCPEKVCRECGEPSRRIVEKAPVYAEFRRTIDKRGASDWTQATGRSTVPSQVGRTELSDGSQFTAALYNTLGFSDCSHDAWRPGCVFDPFAGSGTTLMVAHGHGRDAIGIDLDERNFHLAQERMGFFLELTP